MNKEPCPFDNELLSRYVCCECDSEERMRVERHVRTCRECRRELYELESVWSVLEEWDVEQTPAPFQPERLRAGLEERFGEPNRIPSWRKAFATLWNVGILKPVPVFVVVGAFAAVLAWRDTFTLPTGQNETHNDVAVADATPTPKPQTRLTAWAPAKQGDARESETFDGVPLDVSNFHRSQEVVGVHLEGSDRDILSALNRPSVPLPFTPPRARVTLVSDHSRL